MIIGLAQTDDERIHAVGTFYMDVSLVIRYNGLCDRKSETEMSGCPAAGFVRTIETLKQSDTFRFRNLITGITYGKYQMVGFLF